MIQLSSFCGCITCAALRLPEAARSFPRPNCPNGEGGLIYNFVYCGNAEKGFEFSNGQWNLIHYNPFEKLSHLHILAREDTSEEALNDAEDAA